MGPRHGRSAPRHRLRPGTANSRHLGGGWVLLLAAVAALMVGWWVISARAASTAVLVSPKGASTNSGTAAHAAAPTAGDMSPAAGPRPARSHPQRRWYVVLARLDARRERAWRRGSTALLAQVYVAGSAELALDSAHLRAYLARGLRVEGVSLDVRRLRVVDAHEGMVRLRVVDELGPVRATTADGRTRRLPTDLPTAHIVELRRQDRWRISRITAA